VSRPNTAASLSNSERGIDAYKGEALHPLLRTSHECGAVTPRGEAPSQVHSLCICVRGEDTLVYVTMKRSRFRTSFSPEILTQNASNSCLVNYVIILCVFEYFIIYIYARNAIMLLYLQEMLSALQRIIAFHVILQGPCP